MIKVIINIFVQTNFLKNISANMNKVESRALKASPKIACDVEHCLSLQSLAGLLLKLGPAMDRRRGCKTQKLANYLEFNLFKPLWAPEPGQPDPGHSTAV
jgi:hypothetical protein